METQHPGYAAPTSLPNSEHYELVAFWAIEFHEEGGPAVEIAGRKVFFASYLPFSVPIPSNVDHLLKHAANESEESFWAQVEELLGFQTLAWDGVCWYPLSRVNRKQFLQGCEIACATGIQELPL